MARGSSSLRIPYAIVGVAASREELQAAMDAETHINRAQIRNGDVPPLYSSGVVYVRERKGPPLPGVERFQTARDAYQIGHADCDTLAPWRAAELQERHGERARARVIPSSVGYHVIVEREDGSIEDPSARLGMLEVDVGDGPDTITEANQRRARRGRMWLQKAASMAARVYGMPAGAARTALLRGAQAAATHASSLLDRAPASADTTPAPARSSSASSAPRETDDDDGDDDDGDDVSGRMRARRRAKRLRKSGANPNDPSDSPDSSSSPSGSSSSPDASSSDASSSPAEPPPTQEQVDTEAQQDALDALARRMLAIAASSAPRR